MQWTETATNYEHLTQNFKQAVDQLFPHTDIAYRLHRLADRMLLDARQLDSNRGISAVTIGFFGPKNAGKSYLLSHLIKNDKLKQSIKTGYRDTESTEKLVWYGDIAPHDLDTNAEQFHVMDGCNDTHLAQEVVLVDIPGFTDSSAQAVIKHSLTSCQLKILVLDASDIEREDSINYGAGFDGAYILPIINRLPGDPDKLNTTDYRETLSNKLQHWAPGAIHLDPVLLPHLKHEDAGWSDERLTDTLVQAVLNALALLNDLPQEARGQIALRIERFRAEVQRELPEFTQAIEQVSTQIQAATEAISEDTQTLIGGERIMQMSVRMGMGAKVVNETPALFFPYRSIQRLLVMTSGAWESLTMGLAGSIPSLALTAIKSVRNTRDQLNWSQEIETGLQLRLEKTAYEKVLPPFQQLCDVLQQQNSHSATPVECTPSVEIRGVNALMDESRRVFDQTIAEHAPSRIMNYAFGGLATLIFLALISAPLVAIYKDYVLTAWNLLQTQQVVFSDFPAIQWGVLFGAILLSSIPVFILAGLFLSLSTSQGKIRRCVSALQQAHKELIQHMLKTKRLNILTGNDQLEAAQWLGGFLRK